MRHHQNSIKMNKSWILVLVTVSTLSSWILVGVDSFRSEHGLQSQPQSPRAGCIWTLEAGNNSSSSSKIPVTSYSKNGAQTFSLDCNLRTLSTDFWMNYTFNRDQIEQTSQIGIKCSDKLFFESFLSPNQSLFRLVNLKQIQIDSCKIRKMPSRIWGSLGFLKTLTLNSHNAEWSSSVGLEIEAGSFEGLGQLEILDLSQNGIWSLPNKNIFCPLKSLKKLNLSRNRLSDLEELSESGGGDSSSAYCGLTLENLDLSFNALRRVGNNAFSRMRKLSELRLQNSQLEELEDDAFSGLNQLRQLNLSCNRLVALPPSIFRYNTALRELSLSNNSISAISPQVFLGMDSLLSLDLSRNTLTSQWIKDTMFSGLSRLVILRLSSNQLSYLDGGIFKDLGFLQALYLDGNRIETIHPTAFTAMRNINVLDLSRNRLSFIDSRAFSNLIVLKSLYLDHNKIRSMDDHALKNCTSLQDLGLADNLLTEVPVAIRAGLIHLVTLDIGENRITSISNDSFSGLSQLYGLRIVDNRITEIPRDFCGPIKSLRVLNVAQNRINKISQSAFTSCPELRALRLDSNAMEELPASLAQQLPSLLWFNVSENSLRWADYHLLPPTIEWLDLSYNKLETLGGPGSSQQNFQNFSLRVLDASFNLLSSIDYTTIPPTLETLRVNHNRLTTVSSDTFIRSTRLRRVELIGNRIETLSLQSLQLPPVPLDRPIPDFYLSKNPFNCDCNMEWLTRVNQLTVLRTHPRIVDLDAVVCRPTFKPNQLIPLVEMRPKDFLCPYKSHCFALCHCCDFEFCDCEMTCPGNCTCYHDTAWSANIVQCSNLNYEEVPPRIPMDASEIYLDGNNIELGSHIFIGKKNLRVLFLNDSKIEVIKNKTFNGLRSLEVLRLEDNLLSELQGFEFADLSNLKELFLQNNLLKTIAPSTFSTLVQLSLLRLDGNLLIDYNIWELSGNGYLNSVLLANNPWTCDCEFLIPFRTWVASKNSIVMDFTLATCQTVNSTHVLAGSSSTSEVDHGSKSSPGKLYPIQMQHSIASMCHHNSELNFNFNPSRALESEILTNHISPMAGGAEKVTIPHPTDREIQFRPGDSHSSVVDSMNTFWSLLLSFTALIVLVVVIVAIFRKEIYYWITNTSSRNRSSNRGFFSHICSILPCLCCGEKAGKKSYESGGTGGGGSCEDEQSKLFDAYFIYSKGDEDILQQKIAPSLESQGPPHFRLCLHYRDLCLNPDNPWNTDMILSACDASKRFVLVLSRTFLQSELANPHFAAAIQSAINRHQNKLILILLPPFSEQNLGQVYPELKNTNFGKTSTLEWTDKSFWSKLKLVLPTPSNINTVSNSNTLGRRQQQQQQQRGSSLLISGTLPHHQPGGGGGGGHLPPPLIDLQAGGISSSNNSNASGTSYTINRLDFPYSSSHQYHRNILPYQIPISNCSTLNPPVPKHHIALTTPFFHQNQQHPHQMHQSQYYQSQQNFSLYGGSQYSNPASSQHYFVGNNNLQNYGGGGGGSVVYPVATLPHPHPSFNESFRRHLQAHQQNPLLPPSSSGQGPVLQFAKQQISSGIGGGGGGGNGGTGTGYQPLEPNYSSSAISSSADELEHVYSTLDSPLQSPNSANTTSTSIHGSSVGGCGGGVSSPTEQVKTTKTTKNGESANKLGNSFSNKRNGNSNNTTTNGNGNEFSSQLPPQTFNSKTGGEGQHQLQQPGNNGQMYFV